MTTLQPGECNPDIPGAEQVREFMNAPGYDPASVHALVYDWAPEDVSANSGSPVPPGYDSRVRIAQLHKAYGIAPYVGDPFVYVWYVAIHNGHQLAASQATIHKLPYDPTLYM